MNPYPVTICKARYGGVYEPGAWLAFNLQPQDIPEDAFGEDADCVDWWNRNTDGVGSGATPAEALESLASIERPLKTLWFVKYQTTVLGFAPRDVHRVEDLDGERGR